eukprot:s873_g36.t1
MSSAKTLRYRGFVGSKVCFYNDKCLILLHVDDMLVLTEQSYFDEQLCPTLSGKYKTSVHCMKHAGDSFEFLKRIHTMVDHDTIHIQQNPRHFDKLFEIVGVQGSVHSKKVPCHELMTEVDDTPGLPPEKASRYRSAVGVLLYLASDLIECAYTIRGLAQFMSAPTERAWTMLKHLCLYLMSVRDNSLRLHICLDGLWHSPSNDDGVVLEMFSDSDWAAHKGHRRSVSSGIICFQGCLLLATSRTQKVVALSSAEAEVHAAVSTTCDGLLLRVCIEFCTGEKVRLKIILDNSAAKQVLQRSGVGRIRHLSCRVLWIQQLVKQKQLETCAIPTKHNYADLGTKKLSRDRMHYLMHGVGVFDEHAGTLVGVEVVSREQTASDFKGVLRMLRESVGERSSHRTMVSTKQTLQTLLLMTLMSTSDALSLESPMTFSVPDPFQLQSFPLSLVILFCIFVSAFAMMPVRDAAALEPEPEAETSTRTPVYNKALVYCFLCVCVKRTLELLDDAEFEESRERIGSLSAIHEVLLDTFTMFERDGISASNLRSMMEMHRALQRHDADFNASNHISVETEVEFTAPANEPEVESLLPPDPPSDLQLEDLGEPYAPRSPEHMAMWLIQRITERLERAVHSGHVRKALKYVEQRQVMVGICQMCNRNPDQRGAIWAMMQTLSDLSSSDDEDD